MAADKTDKTPEEKMREEILEKLHKNPTYDNELLRKNLSPEQIKKLSEQELHDLMDVLD